MRVSFIVPVFDTEVDVLRLCVNSVLKAAGHEHEVVLVDDASRRPETRAFVDRCADSGIENLVVLRNLIRIMEHEICYLCRSNNKNIGYFTVFWFDPGGIYQHYLAESVVTGSSYLSCYPPSHRESNYP